MLVDADTIVYLQVSSWYRKGPKAKLGMFLLSVNTLSYPTKQTNVANLSHGQTYELI